jgi:prepilin-type N-terminal cleavage/methylation domain-containing protein
MKNKKGFTLVEVLAVIAILMILVTLSVPRIRTIYDKAKENAFLTEFKNLERQITNKEVMTKMNKKKIVAISSEDETSLELSNKDFKYCIDLNKNGTFSRMQASDGKHYIEANRGDDIHSFTNKNIIKGGYDKLRCVFDENKSLKNVILANNKTYPDNKKSDTVESENGIDFSKPASATNGIGLFYNYNSDDINSDGKVDKTYYFRGLVTNNNVLFADGCYKVVKITEDGAVKLIYNGTPYQGQCSNNMGKIDCNVYNDTIDYMTDKDSAIKASLDKWYKENILQYQEYMQDTIYCNDRSKDDNGEYNTKGRLGASVKKPTNKCKTEDSFTVSNKIGNGKLKYPVGLLTADEYIYSGGQITKKLAPIMSIKSNSKNSIIRTEAGKEDNVSVTTYLYGDYWTMTPSGNTNVYRIDPYGLYSEGIYDKYSYIRPIISLNEKAIVKYGNGSSTNPYVIRINSSTFDSKNCATNIYKKGSILNKMLSNNCAYNSKKKSENVIKTTGINFKYRSNYVPLNYYLYVSTWPWHITMTDEIEFYENLTVNSETGELSLSGKKIKGTWNTDGICTSSSCPVAGYFFIKDGSYFQVDSFYDSSKANALYSNSETNYSELNGKGLYYIEDKDFSEGGKRIYFYRGEVNNNYVALGNMCFSIIRTDENDNVRLIYYGDYQNGKCIEQEEGLGYLSFSNFKSDNTYVGYMTGDLTQKEKDGYAYIYPSRNYYFGTDYEYNSKTKKYKIKGTIVNGKWNTDSICTSLNCPIKGYYTCFKSSKNDECEVLNQVQVFTSRTYYYYDNTISKWEAKVTEIKMQSDSYDKSTSNKNDSDIKKIYDDWYEKNIKPLKIKTADTPFCNDRRVSEDNTGYGDIETKYASSKRTIPTYICNQNDKFTISNRTGNGKLKYPIGLPSYDELEIMDSKHAMTMTPLLYRNSMFGIQNEYYYNFPVIAVSGSTYISQGTGMIDDPYLIVGGK